MADTYIKKIQLDADLTKLNQKLSKLEEKFARMHVGSKNWTKSLNQLNSFYETQNKINKALQDEKKAIENIAKLEERITKFNQQQSNLRTAINRKTALSRAKTNLDSMRKGYDLVTGAQNLATKPITTLLSVGQNFANQKFDDLITSNREQMTANENEMAQNQKRLDELAGKKNLTKNERLEQSRLQASQKQLSAENKKLQASTNKAAAAQAVINTVAKSFKTLLAPLDSFRKNIINATTALLQANTGVASYSSGSLFTNAKARETKLKYGMSDAQSFAFTQAKSMLNINGDEDLMYMNSAQRERLLAYMDKYSQWYNEMESSGVLASIQEMQLEFKEFYNEIAMEFLQWVAENKDTIMTCIRGIFEIVKGIANMVMSIIKLFGGNTNSYASAYSSDTYNSGSTSTDNSRNINLNVNSNITNNGSQMSSQTADDKMWSDIAKQIATATE